MEKNLPNSMMKIIESENKNHCSKEIPATEVNGSKGCDEVSLIKPLFKSRAGQPLQNANAESDGRTRSHPMVVAFNEDGKECAHGFPKDEHERLRMIDNFSELYSRVETVLIEEQKEELFLEEEIIQEQVEQIRAITFRFPESFVMEKQHPFNIA